MRRTHGSPAHSGTAVVCPRFGSALLCAALFGCTGAITDAGSSPSTSGGAGATSGGATGAGSKPNMPGAGAGSTATIGSGGGATNTGSGGSGATPTGSGGATPIDPGSVGNQATPGDPTAAGPMPLRYLTSREYLNTVKDLVGDTSLSADDVPTETTDPTFSFFPFRMPGTVGTVEAELLQGAAEQVVRNLSANINSILPCQPANAGAEAACATQFINTFGAKAYRRPLDATEVTALTNLYQKARTAPLSLDFKGAVGLLVEAMLQSSGFFYHWEKDLGAVQRDASGKVQLGPYQLANRMSYFLFGSMPDAALFSAASSGQLATEAQVDMQARRMLADPKAKGTVADFINDLLDLDLIGNRPKDASVYSMFNESLQAAIRTETETFATNVVFGSGKFDDLLTSTTTSLNQPLAALYGVSGVNGVSFSPAMLNGSQRAGLLTLAGFLASTGASNGSDPPRRGKFVFTRFLCTDLPPPPPVVPAVADPQPGVSTRQRFETHDQNPCTGGCHKILDGIGFAFENYDGIGAYRSMDAGVAVNASVSFALDDGAPTTYANALELERGLAASSKAKACMSMQWLRYALRRPESSDDLASLQAVNSAFTGSGNNIRELIVALVKSRTFRFRAPAAGEVL